MARHGTEPLARFDKDVCRYTLVYKRELKLFTGGRAR
ncbi:unnamed protein product [Chondrus crispus]|uniref:Uncharacterized protein n=1 Tax=Chondrus crispus TaxID=2769 RepID=R7QFJ2_CHOCR|nr:unnamed protein product [Chondrus crispus]CDF36221.1 unnamed protein product [Chondrus crispus]|eukprot:XP_005716040.1 unnamed protein product [Chondrus crispus]